MACVLIQYTVHISGKDAAVSWWIKKGWCQLLMLYISGCYQCCDTFSWWQVGHPVCNLKLVCKVLFWDLANPGVSPDKEASETVIFWVTTCPKNLEVSGNRHSVMENILSGKTVCCLLHPDYNWMACSLASAGWLCRAVRKSRSPWILRFWACAVIFGHIRDFVSVPWLSADYVQNQHSGASLMPTWFSN